MATDVEIFVEEHDRQLRDGAPQAALGHLQTLHKSIVAVPETGLGLDHALPYPSVKGLDMPAEIDQGHEVSVGVDGGGEVHEAVMTAKDPLLQLRDRAHVHPDEITGEKAHPTKKHYAISRPVARRMRDAICRGPVRDRRTGLLAQYGSAPEVDINVTDPFLFLIMTTTTQKLMLARDSTGITALRDVA